MTTVQVLLVSRAVQGAQPVPPPPELHAHLSHKTLTENDCLVNHPQRPWEIRLTLLGIVGAPAVRERGALSFAVDGVDVVLLQLLYPLYMVT